MKDRTLYPPFEPADDQSQKNKMSLSKCFDIVSDIHVAQNRMKSRNSDAANQEKKPDNMRILEEKKYEAAIHAAVEAESEIATLSKGIAELEELLLKEGGSENQNPLLNFTVSGNENIKNDNSFRKM